jgi:hypothetical protein
MSSAALRAVIRAIYDQVDAPDWVAANLDGLADVLRDLSWLPVGPVELALPDLRSLPLRDRRALHEVLARAAAQTSTSARPVRAGPLGPAR